MSHINPEFFAPSTSDMLLNMAKDALKEAGNYPHLESILDNALKPNEPSLSDQFKGIEKGLF
jgi:hypothetical protein